VTRLSGFQHGRVSEMIDQDGMEDEIEIDQLTLELPEGDDPLAGQAMAQQLIRQLAQLLGE